MILIGLVFPHPSTSAVERRASREPRNTKNEGTVNLSFNSTVGNLVPRRYKATVIAKSAKTDKPTHWSA